MRVDEGEKILKIVYNKVRKAEVAMQLKGGKEVHVNDDRGIERCQVWFLLFVDLLSSRLSVLWHNLQVLFSMLDLMNHRECKLVVHLKAANIAVGIQTA